MEGIKIRVRIPGMLSVRGKKKFGPRQTRTGQLLLQKERGKKFTRSKVLDWQADSQQKSKEGGGRQVSSG